MKYSSTVVLMLFALFMVNNEVNSCCSLPYTASNDVGSSIVSNDGCSTVSSEARDLPSGCVFSTITVHCEFSTINVSVNCAYTVCDYGDSGTISGNCSAFVY